MRKMLPTMKTFLISEDPDGATGLHHQIKMRRRLRSSFAFILQLQAGKSSVAKACQALSALPSMFGLSQDPEPAAYSLEMIRALRRSRAEAV
jgi:hypothetical protein